MAQEDFGAQFFGPNLLCTKPGLTYFVQEIQTPITTLHYTTLHYITLHYITLHYIILNDTAPQIDR